MSYQFRTVFFAASLSLALAAPALAQNYDRPDSRNVSQQFSAGANRIGQGANQIGEGFRQGAMLTWHALQNGANAVGNGFTK